MLRRDYLVEVLPTFRPLYSIFRFTKHPVTGPSSRPPAKVPALPSRKYSGSVSSRLEVCRRSLPTIVRYSRPFAVACVGPTDEPCHPSPVLGLIEQAPRQKCNSKGSCLG